MRRFLLLLLLCSSCFLLFSCRSFRLQDATPVSPDTQRVENLYFSSEDKDYVYKGQIDIYGNHISGILAVKKISAQVHRVVMTTDFGNKMLDFEISQHDFKVNYLIPDLDRDAVKKFLEKDFRILLKKDFPIKNAFEDSSSKIYESAVEEESTFLYFDREAGLLRKMVYTEKGREKINFTFEAKTAIFADKIELIHKDFKLRIGLTALND